MATRNNLLPALDEMQATLEQRARDLSMVVNTGRTHLMDAMPIRFEQGAAIAKRAYTERRPVLDVAEEMTDLGRAELETLLDPATLTANKR